MKDFQDFRNNVVFYIHVVVFLVNLLQRLLLRVIIIDVKNF